MADLNAEVVITAKDLASGVLDKFGKKLEDTQGLSNALDKAFTVMGGGLLALGGIAFKATQAFGQQEDAMARLGAGLKNVGESINDQGIALLNQAAALQRTTRFSDEQIISAQGMLTTFLLNTNQIKTLTPKILDMAEALRSSSGGTIDLEQASILLGKAIGSSDVEGLAGALRRVGVVMTEAQTQMLKTGTMEERLTVLTQIMDQNFKGFAEAGGKTFNGQMEIMKNQIGEVMELIGGFVVNAVGPLVDKISKAVAAFNDLTLSMSIPDAIKASLAQTLGESSPVYKFLVFVLDHGNTIKDSLFGIAAGLVAMKAALIGMTIISAVATAFSVLAAVFSAFAVGGLAAGVGTAIAALGGPITLLVLAIGGAAYLIVTHWTTITNAITAAKDWIILKWQELLTFFTTLPATIGLLVDQILLFFKRLPDTIVQMLGDLILWIFFNIAYLQAFFQVKIPEIVNGIILWLLELPIRIKNIFDNINRIILEVIAATAVWLFNELSSWPGKVESFIADIPEIAKAIFALARAAVVDQMERMFQGVSDWWNRIKAVLSAIKDAAEAAINAVQRGFAAGSAAAGKRQVGGFVSASKPYIVGETGPEVFTPTGSGNVTPLSRAGGGASGGVALNVYVGLYAGSQTEKRQIAKELYLALADLAYAQNKTVSELLGA